MEDNDENINGIENKSKLVNYIDKHCFLVTTILGCFYMISSIYAFLALLYLQDSDFRIVKFLLVLYFISFLIYVIYFIVISIKYKNYKYVCFLILGLLIGFLTCGGLWFSLGAFNY